MAGSKIPENNFSEKNSSWDLWNCGNMLHMKKKPEVSHEKKKLSDLYETWWVDPPKGTEQGHRAISQKYPAVCPFLNR